MTGRPRVAELTPYERILRNQYNNRWNSTKWQKTLADPVRHASRLRYNRERELWRRRVKGLLGYPEHGPLPSGVRLVNALHRRALELLALDADPETVYPVWAEWQTLRRLALVKAGLVDIRPEGGDVG